MASSIAQTRAIRTAPAEIVDEAVTAVQLRLRSAFDASFSIWHGPSGRLVAPADNVPVGEHGVRSLLVRAVADCREPQMLREETGVATLAIPLRHPHQDVLVAVVDLALFSERELDWDVVADWLDVAPAAAKQWWDRSERWTVNAALRLASSESDHYQLQAQAEQLKVEVDKTSLNLTKMYEEISLLYTISQNLSVSKSDRELGDMALEWLAECVPAEAVVLQLLPMGRPEDTYEAQQSPILVCSTESPVSNEEFSEMVRSLEALPANGPIVANRSVTSGPGWKLPQVRQVTLAPMVEGCNLFGWLAAINHVDDDEFGSIEATLLNTIAAILGTHSGNVELYRQQGEFLANVVRALTSAIDAKDPYTCGHSDRVARIAVRLARELELNESELHTIYMGGLLHDVGKIGIDDRVLRKPGSLTDEEFEHIKLHPELGYKILKDVRQFEHLLPIVLHHHEQWDGEGYPAGLAGKDIPQLARITAVADAYDAMTSDRPYRKGMPIDQVERIFESGNGKQWDPRVIAAFFAAERDILEISRHERAALSLDVSRWTGQLPKAP
ncbi:MAG: HD-GYP domain-containing protein [Pirellulaceae bacterium]|jgi:HD-GYP domain-containing protein (c-di-GMP phosphodiesterase class II)|nr:HD-GYP domain-containing protein [Pirellulaceae bacterium]MDP7017147.1 HD-GYP domain-containing protein [Pirellulaceae bacterium]